jgi:GWxTD domain-containing protein
LASRRLVALLLAAAWCRAGGAAELRPDDPAPDWRQGPVRYILSVKEDAAYRKLRTPETRREFIEKFWAALDPSPDTALNERRIEFWKRVEEATHQFHDSVFPGWKTDRGKIYVLLGPPDERHLRERGEVWAYRALPQPGAPPEVRLGFVRDGASEYHMIPGALQYHGTLYSRDGTPFGETVLSLMSQTAGAQIVPGRIRMPELPKGEVKSEYFFGTLQFVPRYNYYKAADGTTFITLTVSLPTVQFLGPDGKLQTPGLTLAATVEEFGTSRVVERFSQTMTRGPGALEAPGRPLLFQAGFHLPSGTYRVVFTLYDRQTHHGATYPETIVVPDFRQGLALSTVAVGRAPEEPQDEADLFHLGKLAPLPDPEPVFREGEEAIFSYQVYNAGRRDGQPDLDVEYRFFLQAGSEFQEVGDPVSLRHVHGEALAYSLRLTDWPNAAYLVRIQVTDTLSGASATREEKIRVIESPWTPAPEGSALPSP